MYGWICWWVKSSPLTLNLNRHVVNPIINHRLKNQPFSGNLYIITKGGIPTNRPRLQMFYYWVCPSSRFHPAIACHSQVAPTALARMGFFARSKKSQPAVVRIWADESTVMMSRKSRRLKFYVILHHFTMFVHIYIYIYMYVCIYNFIYYICYLWIITTMVSRMGHLTFRVGSEIDWCSFSRVFVLDWPSRFETAKPPLRACTLDPQWKMPSPEATK